MISSTAAPATTGSPAGSATAWLQVDYKEGQGWFTAAILDHTHATEVGEWMFEV